MQPFAHYEWMSLLAITTVVTVFAGHPLSQKSIQKMNNVTVRFKNI